MYPQVIVALLLGCLSAYASQSPSQNSRAAISADELARRVAPSIVRITGKDAKGRDTEPGRGFFVAPDVIATDYLVVRDAIKIYATNIDKKRKEVRIIGVDSSRTVAILSIEEAKAEPLAVNVENQIDSESLIYFPELSGWSERKVIDNTFIDGRHLIEIAAQMRRELRGSPVLNNRGEVVAIAISHPNTPNSNAFAVSSSALIPLGEISVEGGFLDKQERTDRGYVSEATNGEGKNRYIISGGEDSARIRLVRKPSSVIYNSAIRRVVPLYPPKAKKSRIVGLVTVEMLIDEKGDVLRVRAISGHQYFKEAATAAARGWKFPPSNVRGQPIRVIGILTFSFTS